VVSILPKRMEGTIMIDARQVTAGDLGL
jgi:hypothetical protein